MQKFEAKRYTQEEFEGIMQRFERQQKEIKNYQKRKEANELKKRLLKERRKRERKARRQRK